MQFLVFFSEAGILLQRVLVWPVSFRPDTLLAVCCVSVLFLGSHRKQLLGKETSSVYWELVQVFLHP
jgi:hypothetical protein